MKWIFFSRSATIGFCVGSAVGFFLGIVIGCGGVHHWPLKSGGSMSGHGAGGDPITPAMNGVIIVMGTMVAGGILGIVVAAIIGVTVGRGVGGAGSPESARPDEEERIRHFRTNCPRCKADVETDEVMVGKYLACPTCREVFLLH